MRKRMRKIAVISSLVGLATIALGCWLNVEYELIIGNVIAKVGSAGIIVGILFFVRSIDSPTS